MSLSTIVTRERVEAEAAFADLLADVALVDDVEAMRDWQLALNATGPDGDVALLQVFRARRDALHDIAVELADEVEAWGVAHLEPVLDAHDAVMGLVAVIEPDMPAQPDWSAVPREVALSDCAFGCKEYELADRREVLHSRTYGCPQG